MQKKQHSVFKGRFLVVLFLFFNFVCTAASVLRLTSENYKDAVCFQLAQFPNPSGNEEENHAAASGYINQVADFSVRKVCEKRIYNGARSNSTVSLASIESSSAYIPDAGVLPVPGHYAFLFRYTLF